MARDSRLMLQSGWATDLFHLQNHGVTLIIKWGGADMRLQGGLVTLLRMVDRNWVLRLLRKARFLLAQATGGGLRRINFTCRVAAAAVVARRDSLCSLAAAELSSLEVLEVPQGRSSGVPPCFHSFAHFLAFLHFTVCFLNTTTNIPKSPPAEPEPD